ncbi:MAG: L-lactate dehydrogenase, partial [Lachnospiraceae bacterium]|nr:L-lactate dehydrogenase [Lachnospiraceae bacterium]
MSVVRICRAIVMNERSILPVSSILHGEYGIHDIALSMPAVIGEEGVETQVPIVLSEEEQTKLQESAEALKQVAEQITF